MSKKNIFQHWLFLFFISFSISNVLQAQFFLNSSAVALNDSCYQLTSENDWEVGSIWNGTLISLEESFDVFVDISLGCKDENGADGIIFGLQPISTSIGVGGGDIGFGGVTPSLGVEIDTHQNIDFGDPVADHIAIVQDGNLNHNTTSGSLAGPVPASDTNINIEDCNFHSLRVTWNVVDSTLTVYFDCELRLTYTGDIINNIFNGDPMVYWGFTSATGGLNNEHQICFSYTSFINELEDLVVCPGEAIQLEADGGLNYNWSPSEGLSATDIANPIASPTETTLYTVEIIDDCGLPFYDDVLVTVDNNQFDLDITIDPTDLEEIFPGETFNLTAMVSPEHMDNYIYQWSSLFGSTFTPIDEQTTTVTASSEYTGTETFILTVSSLEGCVKDTMVSLNIIGPEYDIPNVFSPNGDNINERFGLFTSARTNDYSCAVFNRWGQPVFETNERSLFWDGTSNNTAAPSDVYIYLIKFEIAGVEYEEKGSLTLIR